MVYTDIVTLLTCRLTKCFFLNLSFRTSEKTPLVSVMLQGPTNSDTTAVAAKVAVDSGFPFVHMISANDMIGYSDSSKSQIIHKAFLGSYKSPLFAHSH
jgi:vesicle-fusing ATPase